MALKDILNRKLLIGGLIAVGVGAALGVILIIYLGDLNRLNRLAHGICEAGHENLDTCAMLLAADAAKQSVYLTAFVLLANAMTLIGVYLTLRATHKSADASDKSARTALKSLILNRANIVSSMAIVEINTTTKGFIPNPPRIKIAVEWTNVGKSYAVNVSEASVVYIKCKNDKLSHYPNITQIDKFDRTCQSGSKFVGSEYCIYHDNALKIINNVESITITSHVTFRDISDSEEWMKTRCTYKISQVTEKTLGNFTFQVDDITHTTIPANPSV